MLQPLSSLQKLQAWLTAWKPHEVPEVTSPNYATPGILTLRHCWDNRWLLFLAAKFGDNLPLYMPNSEFIKTLLHFAIWIEAIHPELLGTQSVISHTGALGRGCWHLTWGRTRESPTHDPTKGWNWKVNTITEFFYMSLIVYVQTKLYLKTDITQSVGSVYIYFQMVGICSQGLPFIFI